MLHPPLHHPQNPRSQGDDIDKTRCVPEENREWVEV